MGDVSTEAEAGARTPGRRALPALLLGTGVSAALVMMAGLVAILFPGAIGGLAGLPVAPEPRLEAAVHELFDSADAEDVVVLAEATDFGWDSVGVFGPYHPHEAVVDDMGVRVPRGASNNLAYDERCLLVFRRGDRAVAWTVVSREVADCSGEASGRVYTVEQAAFEGDRLFPARG